MTKIENILEEYNTGILHSIQNNIGNQILESAHLETQSTKSA